MFDVGGKARRVPFILIVRIMGMPGEVIAFIIENHGNVHNTSEHFT